MDVTIRPPISTGKPVLLIHTRGTSFGWKVYIASYYHHLVIFLDPGSVLAPSSFCSSISSSICEHTRRISFFELSCSWPPMNSCSNETEHTGGEQLWTRTATARQ